MPDALPDHSSRALERFRALGVESPFVTEVVRVTELSVKGENYGTGPTEAALARVLALDELRAENDALKAERTRYRDALLTIGERVTTFGGFQRTPRGQFWISRDDVLRAIDEAVGLAPEDAAGEDPGHGS